MHNCRHHTANAGQNVHEPRAAKSGLTGVEGRRRADIISHVQYLLSFDLEAFVPDYHGAVKIKFDYQQSAECLAELPLTVDFAGGTIQSLSVNGQVCDPERQYNGFFVAISQQQLKTGANEIAIAFAHPHSKTGTGFYRFKDAEDGLEYLFTDFEPFNANTLFPCLDQPDLKASYTLEVKAPDSWVVVSSQSEVEVVASSGGRKLWKFPPTKPFSTYLFSLHAGPYKIWSDNSTPGIPFRLMARQSMARYVDHESWFTITRQGMKFFQEYFDFEYPFHKYDQLVVPDFNAGAMENVAAVTFSERFIQRGQSTDADREDRASVILHEMAHMWFGNLVTMRWWSDLWLNESFATFMAALAAAEATEFSWVWQSFNLGMKQWAYFEDQLVTTHPIAVDEIGVPNTDQAFANFDGITYGKGASVLKSLEFYLGATVFRDGMRAYFKKHAFGNAELKDFIDALASAAKQDLSHWTEEWLRKPGLNTIEVVLSPNGNRLGNLELRQTAPVDHPTLRTHRTKVGLFDEDSAGKLTLRKAYPVTYQSRSTIFSETANEGLPALIYPNHDDMDFCKVKLDSRSLKTLESKLSSVDDPLLRTMLWQSLWEMVRDVEIDLQTYVRLLKQNIAGEGNALLLSGVLNTVTGGSRGRSCLLGYLAEDESKDPWSVERRRTKLELEQFFWSHGEKARPGSDHQKFWFDALVSSIHSKDSVKKITALLMGRLKIDGFELDQDRRWNVIIQLCSQGVDGAKELLAAEKLRDPSRSGELLAIEAEVSMPDLRIKQQWFDRIVAREGSLSLAQLRSAMSRFFPFDQEGMRQKFAAQFFEHLLILDKIKDKEFLLAYCFHLVPIKGERESVAALADFIEKHPEITAVSQKRLRIAHQEGERTARIRALARSRQVNN